MLSAAHQKVVERSRRAALEAYHRTGERPGDAVDHLHASNHQLAQLSEVAGLGASDHVVGASHVLGLLHALDLDDVLGDLGRLADLGLDEDVCRHHRYRPPYIMPPAPCSSSCRGDGGMR